MVQPVNAAVNARTEVPQAPSHSEFVNNFDLWRLIAASQVVAVHAMAHLKIPDSDRIADVLQLLPGVPVFFFISGYLVSGSYTRSRGLADYAQRRSLRIFPGLWICLVVGIITFMTFGGIRPPLAQFMPWLLAQLSVAQFFNPDFLRGYGVGVLNGSLWTIPVELQFYVVLPVLFGLFSSPVRWRQGLAIAFTAIAIAANVVLYAFHGTNDSTILKLFTVTFVPHVYFFILGMLAFLYRGRLIPLVQGRFGWWLPAYIVIALLLEAAGLTVRGNGMSPVFAPIMGMMLLAGAYTRPQLTNTLLRGNDISYGTYIYHMLVVNVLVQCGYVGRWEWWIAAFAATLLIATASWKFVEHPCLRLKRKFSPKKDDAAAALVGAKPH